MVTFVDGFDLPPFFCPVTKIFHHADNDLLEKRCIEWADDAELYANPADREWGVVGTRAWLLGALACPTADPERLFPLLMFLTWGLAIDDGLMGIYTSHDIYPAVGSTASPAGNAAAASSLLAILVDMGVRFGCSLESLGQVPPQSDRFVSSLSAVGKRARDVASPMQMQRFIDAFRRTIMFELWAASRIGLDSIPPPLDDYVIQRPYTSLIGIAEPLMAVANCLSLSSNEVFSQRYKAALNAFLFVVGWQNDLLSYPKEKFQGEAATNAVAVIGKHLGCRESDAVIEAVSMRDRVMLLFLALCEQIKRTASDDMGRHLDSLVSLVRGHLEWACSIARYRTIDRSVPPELMEPLLLEFSDVPLVSTMEPLEIGPIQWWWSQLGPDR
jgi:hypothetical protein